MAITNIVGNDGTITMPITTSNGVINRWRASFPKVVSATGGFGDSNIARNRLGMTSCEGSATGIPAFDCTSLDPGVGDRPVGGSTTVLIVQTGCSYTMALAFNNITHDVNKFGESILTFDFVNGDTDVLTVAWDESA